MKMFKVLSLLLTFLWAASANATCGTPATWNLTAGQHIYVGTVEVSNDLSNLYVTYNLDTSAQPDASFGTLHLWVGSDLLTLPRSGRDNSGAPVPGQFPWSADTQGAQSYTFTIPLTDLMIQDIKQACGLALYVVTHAEVNGVNDNGSLGSQTAFGGDLSGDGNRWWYYGVYNLQCDCGTVGLTKCTTAFGKGNYVWTTDRKSNPENLPTLALIRNRWGWALNLGSPTTVVKPLYAGAGLNDTSRGQQVGTVTTNWDGSSVSVTYAMNAGSFIREAHVYAGDASPLTTAPGQYGATRYFGEDGTNYYTESFPASDTNGDGVWVISHSVACFPQ